MGSTVLRQTLRLDHLSKSFGSHRVLNDVSMEFHPGVIHALLGANGAGKSTLGWLLAGRFGNYMGSIFFDGNPVKLTSRRNSIKLGIHIVTQEPALAPNLSIAANLFLGVEQGSYWHSSFLTNQSLLGSARTCLAEFDLKLNPSAPISELTLEQKQAVDLLRAYMRKPSFLVVDEPPLNTEDSAYSILDRVAEKLCANGTHLLLITHQVSKALRMADIVTVMRDGHMVATQPTKESSEAEVVKLMFPSIVSAATERIGEDQLQEASATTNLELVLNSSLSVNSRSLTLRNGCVTGLRTKPSLLASKILRSLVKVDNLFDIVLVFGERRFSPKSPKEALQEGVYYLSADRELEASFPNLSVRDNLTFYLLNDLAVLGIVKRGFQYAIAKKLAMQVGIDQRRLDDSLRDLSGGNQQRTLLARISSANPKVCLLDEPNH
ncbi:MAG: ATP-binding cassette domain-containing protein, partial [Deltaproteobacteria bacterium]|nr:ATP-binding cassette domain-containing protein [Deltaproteobacteria bacterium]